MRAMYPNRTMTSAKLGSRRYFTWVAAFAPGGAVALTGSHWSQRPKIRMRTIAVTNSGIAVSDRPVIVIRRSDMPPAPQAGDVPPRMLSGTTSTNATAASLSELTKDGPSRSETGTWYWSDVPRSPWTKWLIQSQYCGTSGRSSPAALLKLSTSCWLANGPSTLRPMSPGSTCAAAKTMHAEQEKRDQRVGEPLEQEPGDGASSGSSAGPPRAATARL